MTNKEAIRILGLECDDWETSHCTPSERREAFDMAISALQAQDIDACRVPEVAKDTNVLNNDTISRQAAINVTWEEPTYTDPLNVLTEVRDRIKALPSVQPEIIRCKDCKFYTAYDYTGKLMCKRIGKGMILPKTEDYCSYAERITDE